MAGCVPRRWLLAEAASLRPAVFLDRDGTIAEEVGYLNDISRFRMFPFAAQAIRQLNGAKLPVIVITNQSGVGRGYFDEVSVGEVHNILHAELAAHDAKLDGVYVCIHHPDVGCACRKPNPGMLLQAQREMQIDLTQSFVIGDRYLDIETARKVGAKGILVLTGNGREEQANHKTNAHQPDFVAENLMDAVNAIFNGVVA